MDKELHTNSNPRSGLNQVPTLLSAPPCSPIYVHCSWHKLEESGAFQEFFWEASSWKIKISSDVWSPLYIMVFIFLKMNLNNFLVYRLWVKAGVDVRKRFIDMFTYKIERKLNLSIAFGRRLGFPGSSNLQKSCQ